MIELLVAEVGAGKLYVLMLDLQQKCIMWLVAMFQVLAPACFFMCDALACVVRRLDMSSAASADSKHVVMKTCLLHAT